MPPPRFAALPAIISVGLGILIIYKLVVLEWPVWRLFGEAMMLTYYGYLYPLSLRLKRGFFEQGVRFDRGFARWEDVKGLTWHHEGPPVLVAAYGHQRAGRLTVPLEHLGAARRVLRDRIAAHQITLHARAPRPRRARRAGGCSDRRRWEVIGSQESGVRSQQRRQT